MAWPALHRGGSISCCSVLSILLLRNSAAGWGSAPGGAVPHILLRGGCAGSARNKPAGCPLCTKVHGPGDRCKAERTMAARAAAGRRSLASDGWALLSTKRGAASSTGAAGGPAARDAKVGQPKGVTEYGWGETAYAQSLAVNTQIGEGWAGDFCVLGIETSCDDTAAAVVHSNGTILGECKRTQDELHAQWGGVVPGLARDAHQEAIEEVVAEALKNADKSPADVDAVAVTMGPGLEICLRVGFKKALAVATEFERPFVSVHHLEAHVLTVRQSDPSIKFPFLVLLVSGGHCQLLVAVAVGEYKMLGGTLDDSLGEAYDKSARMLGLDVGGGGGQVLEALAKNGDPQAVKFGIPMKNRKDCHFSFAGLKTAVRLAIQKAGGDLTSPLANTSAAADIAASFQHVAIRHLEDRVLRALKLCREDTSLPELDSLVVCGGVAANQQVRARLVSLADKHAIRAVFPPARLCTDNGVMVAWAGIERLRLGAVDDPCDMDVRARWPLGITHTPQDAIKSDGTVKVISTKHTKLESTRSVVPATTAAAATSEAGEAKGQSEVRRTGAILGAVKDGRLGKREGLAKLWYRVAEKLGLKA